MRETFIAEIKKNAEWEAKVKVLFMVAMKKDSPGFDKVKEEAQTHRDILILDMEDSFEMNTVKSIKLMEYFLHKCYAASDSLQKPFFLKGSDDLIIFPETLMKTFETLRQRPEGKFCAGVKATAYGVEFLSASAYIISKTAVKELFSYAKCYQEIPTLEDVFLTGALAGHLNIPLVSVVFETNHDGQPEEIRDNLEALEKYAIINNVNAFTVDDQYRIWDLVTKKKV